MFLANNVYAKICKALEITEEYQHPKLIGYDNLSNWNNKLPFK